MFNNICILTITNKLIYIYLFIILICSLKFCQIFYSALLAMLKGDTRAQSGESSSQQLQLPESYASDTRKFFDDSSSSLNGHTKRFVEKVDQMMKEVDDHGAIWKGKLTEMKKQAEHIASQKTKVVAQLSEFAKNG